MFFVNRKVHFFLNYFFLLYKGRKTDNLGTVAIKVNPHGLTLHR
ncbi:hypothetical protein [Enterococcus phage MDA2]|uniref:Uncharacterized protein n=1 Tax=Enterococcus phage MDA2 TaxID=2816459 RepID=A0AAE7UUW9_9CAUD|nr:hypothetical protein [Enterococcus phage MDA2]